jgi:response regulator RpfG family c-di-GMP phosphodiesterase
MYSRETNQSLRKTILEKFDKIDSIFTERSLSTKIKTHNIILVDDDAVSNSLTKSLIYKEIDITNILVFKKPEDVIDYLTENSFVPDILFIDYTFKNSHMSGTDLINKLKSDNLIPTSTKYVILTAGYNIQEELRRDETLQVVLKPLSMEFLKEHLNFEFTLEKI